MSVCKRPFTVYKTSCNKLYIDQRISSYDFELQKDKLEVYIFNIEHMTCFYMSNMKMRQPCLMQEIFPEDLLGFFETLLKNSLQKPQTVHVKLNDKHVLFTTQNINDPRNKIIGIIIYEIPFSNVQSLRTQRHDEFQKHIVNIIMDKNGVLFAMEKHSWDTFVSRMAIKDSQRYKSNMMLHTSLVNHIPCEFLRNVLLALFNHILENDDIPPMRFSWYCDDELIQRKMTSTFSKVVNQEPYVLLNTEVIGEETFEIPVDYLAYEYKKNGFPVCLFCKRIKLYITDDEYGQFKHLILNYNKSLPPLYDEETCLPFFGKRSKNNIQSYKSFSSKPMYVWAGDNMWQSRQKLYSNHPKCIFYTMCEICHDEWVEFLTIQNIAVPNIINNSVVPIPNEYLLADDSAIVGGAGADAGGAGDSRGELTSSSNATYGVPSGSCGTEGNTS